MKVSRIMFNNREETSKWLAECSIILEDCIKLNYIRLYKNEKGYFLVFPSKQDDFQEMQELNSHIDVRIPKKKRIDREYDEFFFPLDKKTYNDILNSVVYCYRDYIRTGKMFYHL